MRGGSGGFWGANGRQNEAFGDEWDRVSGQAPYGQEAVRAELSVHREMAARAFVGSNV